MFKIILFLNLYVALFLVVNLSDEKTHLQAMENQSGTSQSKSVSEKPRAIYHAHNMSFKDIILKIPHLAELGFSHIQVSPPQKSRDTYPDTATQSALGIPFSKETGPLKYTGHEKTWWLHYQPEKYEISDPALGTEEDFKELVTQAKKHNMGIIVDLILTHMRAPEHVNGDYFKKAMVNCGIFEWLSEEEKGKEGEVKYPKDPRGYSFDTKAFLAEDMKKLERETIANDIKNCKEEHREKLETLYKALIPDAQKILGIKIETIEELSKHVYPWRIGYQPGSWTSGFGAPALRVNSLNSNTLVARKQKEWIQKLLKLGVSGFRYDAASNLPVFIYEEIKDFAQNQDSFFHYAEIVATGDKVSGVQEWQRHSKIAYSDYQFLDAVKKSLTPSGNFQDLWGTYDAMGDDQITFTATHDTFGLGVAMGGFAFEDIKPPYSSHLISDDHLLGIAVILSMSKGTPLILHNHLQPESAYVGRYETDPTRIVRHGLLFRKAMEEKRALKDYWTYGGDPHNSTLMIERLENEGNTSQGFAVIHKGEHGYSLKEALKHAHNLGGIYKMIEHPTIVVNVSGQGRDAQITIKNGEKELDDLSLSRNALFFVKKF